MRQNPEWRARYAFSDDAKYDKILLLNPFHRKEDVMFQLLQSYIVKNRPLSPPVKM